MRDSRIKRPPRNEHAGQRGVERGDVYGEWRERGDESRGVDNGLLFLFLSPHPFFRLLISRYFLFVAS